MKKFKNIISVTKSHLTEIDHYTSENSHKGFLRSVMNVEVYFHRIQACINIGASSSPSCPSSIQLFTVVWESSRRQPKCLGLCTHMEDQEEAPGSWLQINAALATVAI